MIGKGYDISASASLSRGAGVPIRQRVVLGLDDTDFSAWQTRRLRGLGWIAYPTQSGEQARRLCRQHSPQVVVLDTGLEDQSGWLVCEKVLRDDPTLKVILLASQSERDGEAFAEFVGPSKLIRQTQGPQAVIDEIVGTTSAVVG